MATFENVPESDEVRAEKRRRFDFGFEDKREQFADWFENLDTEGMMKFYFSGLLILMALTVFGKGFKTVVEWCIKSKEDKHARAGWAGRRS